MTVFRWPRTIALLALFGLASIAYGQTPESPDGLVKVAARRMELAWLRPGADFRPYTKVIVGQTQVAFMPNWLKDYNLNADLGSRISQAQANQIMAAAQTNFDEIYRDTFRKAGYEVVTAPGPDVLRVNSAILDLDVNAPAGQSGFANDVDHHRGSGRADRGGPRFDHQRIARPGRRQARDPRPGPADSVQCNQPLRFPPALHPLGGHLYYGARRVEGRVADTEGPEAQPAPLSAGHQNSQTALQG